MSWKIEVYETPQGRGVVEEYIDSLQDATKAKLIHQIDLLKEFGPQLRMPNAKPVGNGLYELRVRGREESRIIYAYIKRQTIYLLHGFTKKTSAIPRKDIQVALSRKKEVESSIT